MNQEQRKRELYYAICRADAAAQKRKEHRFITMVAIPAICVFIFLFTTNSEGLFQDLIISIVAGFIIAIGFSIILSLFMFFSGGTFKFPEDAELERLKRQYYEEFGEYINL